MNTGAEHIIRQALRQVKERGAARIRALEGGDVEALATALDRDSRLIPLEQIGEVRQGAVGFGIEPSEHPLVAQLADSLSDVIRRVGPPGLRDWVPNEAFAMRYTPGGDGISAHHDSSYYEGLIASYTLTGSAEFAVLRSRTSSEVVQSWTVVPGELVLLRAPGFSERPDCDERPLHRVSAPLSDEPRLSLTFRFDSRRRG